MTTEEQTQTLVERVARGICMACKQDPDFEYSIGSQSQPLFQEHFFLWQKYTDAAQAAIAACHVEELREALRRFVYETTHLSPEESDGSHWCKISPEYLAAARALLDKLTD